MILGPTRIKLGLPTRRPKERPSELSLILSNQTTPVEERKIPVSEYPAAIPGLLLPTPGILAGEKPHDRMVGQSWIGYIDDRAQKIMEETGKGIRLATFNNHVFSQMLAKIAHSYAVAERGFHSFRPLLRDLIIGTSQTASYWVGGNGPVKPAQPEGLHRLELKREMLLGTEYVIVYIRLFCNFGAPEYRVVVGTSSEGR
jgi:hypothetical protein